MKNIRKNLILHKNTKFYDQKNFKHKNSQSSNDLSRGPGGAIRRRRVDPMWRKEVFVVGLAQYGLVGAEYAHEDVGFWN
jgi:hypothetical protein